MNGNQGSLMFDDVPIVNPATGTKKRCTKCGIEKQIQQFKKRTDKENVRRNQCNLCVSKYNKKYRRDYYEKNREKLIVISTIYNANNPDKVKDCKNRWKRKHYYRQQRSSKRKRLICNMRMRFHNLIHKSIACKAWEQLTGYTEERLRIHLESKFYNGMTWGNYGRGGWSLDHIIPIEYFKFNTSNDMGFKLFWSLGNLQPLWLRDNVLKSNKISEGDRKSLLDKLQKQYEAITQK
jgi:hypothetical protein